MQCDNWRLKDGGGPTKCATPWKKCLKPIRKKKHCENRQPCSHIWHLTNLKHTQCKSKGKLKMMLKKKDFEIFSWSQYVFLSTNYLNGGMHVATTRKRSSCTSLKWAWKDNELKLFVFIASNTNRQRSEKDLEAMLGTIIT